jgi:predicted RNA polymerase sigma factor
MMSRVSLQSVCHPEDRATDEKEEEEVDVDVCLAAAVEDRPVVGVRRSARLSANAGARQSLHIAQLLQEQTEEEAVCFVCFIFGYCAVLFS